MTGEKNLNKESPLTLFKSLANSQASLQDSVEELQRSMLEIAKITVATTQATFNSLDPQQKDIYCRTLQNNGLNSNQIENLVNRSQSTVSRHLNGKNS